MSVQAITRAIELQGVSSSEKLLLIVLANYADKQDRCYPSHRTIAEDSCLSQRTILTLMKALEDRGLVVRRERRRADGSRSTDEIELCILGGEVIAPRPETIAPGVGKSSARGGEVIAPLTTFEPRTNRTTEPLESPKRGTRLAEDWTPTSEQHQWAVETGLTAQEATDEADRFRDYWCAVAGAKGRHVSWDGTWRNWVRRACDDRRGKVARMAAKPRVANGRDGGNASFADLFLQRHGQGQE